jgi:ferredoxin
MQRRLVEIGMGGKTVRAAEGETILHALWAAGLGGSVQAGCVGGVCGACTVSVRFRDGRKGGTDLACLRPVEEGMEVFPYILDSGPTAAPAAEPTAEKLRAAFPTLDRCTKCGNCTAVCPMAIPVMDSVLRMQQGRFDAVAEDFMACIHCGLCRFVCEDKVKPHNMGLWVRRSLGIAHSRAAGIPDAVDDEQSRLEWDYLLNCDPEERLRRAVSFRQTGKLLGAEG